MIAKPWVEVHRPSSIQDVIFTDARMAKIFAKYVADGEIPNLLLYGSQGTGKTSISKALIRDLDVDSLDVLRINCSDEKIEAMRDKVKSFAQTMPISAFKVVQLEEMDYLSYDAQALLRSLMEDVSGTCRFIGTCNYINKVLPALRSRMQEFHVAAPDRDEVMIRCAEILEKRSVEFDVDDLEKVVAAAYPDFRKIIQLLQQFSGTGTLVLAETGTATDWKLQLLPLLDKGDVKAARKLVCDSATKEEVVDVFRFLYDNLGRTKAFKSKEDQAIVLIAQYQYQHAFVADVEINVAALFIELGAL